MKLRILAVVLIGVIAGVYLEYFYPWTTNEVESISADGMYRCRVVEKTSAFKTTAHIYLDKRDGDEWHEFSQNEVSSSDSVTSSSYSIDWHYDQRRVTQGVTVHGLIASEADAIFTWRVAEKGTP